MDDLNLDLEKLDATESPTSVLDTLSACHIDADPPLRSPETTPVRPQRKKTLARKKPSPRNPKVSVHFALPPTTRSRGNDENDETDNDVSLPYHLPLDIFTDEELESGWWTKEETRLNYKNAKSKSLQFRDSITASTEAELATLSEDFNELFRLCNETSSVSKVAAAECNRSISKIPDDCRGLERIIHPLLSSYRAKHVQHLLQIQSKIPAKIDQSNREKILCVKSLQTSKPCRMFAKYLGYRDATHVAEIVRDELGLSNEEATSAFTKTTVPLFRGDELKAKSKS